MELLNKKSAIIRENQRTIEGKQENEEWGPRINADLHGLRRREKGVREFTRIKRKEEQGPRINVDLRGGENGIIK